MFGEGGFDGLAATSRVGRSDEARQPSIGEAADASQLRWGDAAEPHVEVRLVRRRANAEGVVVEALAVMGEGLAGPARAQHGHALVEPRRSFRSLDAEGLLFIGVGDPEAERRKEPALRQPVEGGERFGEHDRVPSGQHHHAHPELEPRGPAGGEGHRHEGVGSLASEPLAEPQAVEAESLECVDHGGESGVVEARLNAEAETDAYLHRPHRRTRPNRCRWPGHQPGVSGVGRGPGAW
ncbi:MAG: hypothetical protein FD127_3894 [Acidimicrobiaceae bacterium]|nr:MAG: hypothetical protein FD127_3894 [Acidimicrobiaceae bacterium]